MNDVAKPTIDLLDGWECPVDFKYSHNIQQSVAGELRRMAESLEKYTETLSDDFANQVKETASWALEWLLKEEYSVYVSFDGERLPMQLRVSLGMEGACSRGFDFKDIIVMEVDARMHKDGNMEDVDRFLEKIRQILIEARLEYAP